MQAPYQTYECGYESARTATSGGLFTRTSIDPDLRTGKLTFLDRPLKLVKLFKFKQH